MHLISCEHPHRVHNQYTDEWLFVPCGKCNTCRNRKASTWIARLESERSKSDYTFFVTLTYDDIHLPFYYCEDGFNKPVDEITEEDIKSWNFVSNRSRDFKCIPFNDLNVISDVDFRLFYDLYRYRGIPYASRSDIQLFNKRLNKYFKDNVSDKFKNFRYFIVSEYGSTTLRPHFHAIYFINDSEVARHFSQGIFSCWQQGRVDTQFVEKSACSYVAQYINKSADLPSFYKAGPLSPFFLFSRNPIIGNGDECTEIDKETFYKCSPTRLRKESKDSPNLVIVANDKGFENRLYPKCVLFGSLSHSLRVELYSITGRFIGKRFKDFFRLIRCYMQQTFEKDFSIFHFDSTLSHILLEKFWKPYTSGFKDDFKAAVNWLRRLYYLSKKCMKRAFLYGISIDAFVQKIEEYYNNKAQYVLSEFYSFQESYVKRNDCADLALMYPEYLYFEGATCQEFAESRGVVDYLNMVSDAAQKAFNSKRTHFKNTYLDSLKDKEDYKYLFNILKTFYYAKKCNETLEALAT